MAQGNEVYDLMRVKGNLIIILQDEMFLNMYLGTNGPNNRPSDAASQACRVQAALMEYLKTKAGKR